LQGRISGVNVSGDGRPGVPAKVRIRGFSSLSGQNDPLYIVDGVPTLEIETLNPDDVETISVLKDAGAASIYGSRAANGVVLIKTKQGQNTGVQVNYSMYYGGLSAGDRPDFLLNAQEYADLQWLVYRNDGTEETHPVYGPSTNASPTLPSWGADTDWWDVVTQNATVMNHHLSLSGGNDRARFYGGVSYFHQDGIVLNNFTKRVTARLNSEFKVANNRLTFGENFTIAGRNGLGIFGNGDEDSPVTSVYRLQPLIPHIIHTPVAGSTHNFVEGEYGGTGIAPRLGNSWNEYARRIRNKDDREVSRMCVC
jgi:TonB-dependent SusC/RagA subfamily outer membrane receptor